MLATEVAVLETVAITESNEGKAIVEEAPAIASNEVKKTKTKKDQATIKAARQEAVKNTAKIAAEGLKIITPVTVVLDNAKYQRCLVVTALAEELGIELLFLPPYSANLN